MAKANILIVDPSASAVAELKSLLLSRGHHVTVCDNPMDAIFEFNQQLTDGAPSTFVLCRDDLGPDYTQPGAKQRFHGADLLRGFNHASQVLPDEQHPVFIGASVQRGNWHTLGPLTGWFEEVSLLGNTPDELKWNLKAITSIMEFLGYYDASQPRCLLPA